ncbi:MAG: AAA family ATPase [Candidatus Gastranaerophilaceae bacterium]
MSNDFSTVVMNRTQQPVMPRQVSQPIKIELPKEEKKDNTGKVILGLTALSVAGCVAAGLMKGGNGKIAKSGEKVLDEMASYLETCRQSAKKMTDERLIRELNIENPEKFPSLKELSYTQKIERRIQTFINGAKTDKETLAENVGEIAKIIQRKKILVTAGEPGTGKSTCQQVIAKELDAVQVNLSYSEIASSFVDGQTKNFQAWQAKLEEYAKRHPSQNMVISIDEVDSFFGVGNRNSSAGEAQNKLVNEMKKFLEEIVDKYDNIYLVASTNNPEIIDTAIKSRAGGIVEFGTPTLKATLDKLKKMNNLVGVGDDAGKLVDEQYLTKMTKKMNKMGFSYRDIVEVYKKALTQFSSEITEQGKNFKLDSDLLKKTLESCLKQQIRDKLTDQLKSIAAKMGTTSAELKTLAKTQGGCKNLKDTVTYWKKALNQQGVVI